MKRKPDGAYQIVNDGHLRFKHWEYYNDQDGALTYTIYDSENLPVVTEADQALTIIRGRNLLELNLGFGGDCIPQGYYILETVNEKNERAYLRFYQAYSPCTPYTPNLTQGPN